MDEKDTASRKWQLTFNNPEEHGWTHDKIREVLRSFKTMAYWCMADEIGAEEKTPHTHLFINLSPSNCHFSTLKNKFPGAHIEKVLGTSQDNRDYISKSGKWKDTEKGTTSVEGSFEEFGECPIEHQGKGKEADRILELLKDGANNLEVIEEVPGAMKFIDKGERTRSVMDRYGYANCYRVTDYRHPFDTYDGQDVLIFEEFRGGLKHGDMLNYLDGYPLLLPCRYFNRQACYTKVFIITNIPPDVQYMNVDLASREAFYRRIHKVIEFCDGGKFTEYVSVQAYIDRHKWADNLADIQAMDLDQLSL